MDIEFICCLALNTLLQFSYCFLFRWKLQKKPEKKTTKSNEIWQLLLVAHVQFESHFSFDPFLCRINFSQCCAESSCVSTHCLNNIRTTFFSVHRLRLLLLTLLGQSTGEVQIRRRKKKHAQIHSSDTLRSYTHSISVLFLIQYPRHDGFNIATQFISIFFRSKLHHTNVFYCSIQHLYFHYNVFG